MKLIMSVPHSVHYFVVIAHCYRVKEESEQLHKGFFFLRFFPSFDQMLFSLFVVAFKAKILK